MEIFANTLIDSIVCKPLNRYMYDDILCSDLEP